MPPDASAADVRAAYENLFGEPMDVLVELIEGDVYRFPADFVLCAGEPTAWDGDVWSAAGPVGCADDPNAVGLDQRGSEFGDVKRTYVVDFDGSLLDASASNLVAPSMRSCTWQCSAEQRGTWLEPGTSKDGDAVRARLLPPGPYRIEVRSELDALPVDDPGIFTILREFP